MAEKVSCTLCETVIVKRYMPMKEWQIQGPLCGKCYSAKLGEHYPGKHVRM